MMGIMRKLKKFDKCEVFWLDSNGDSGWQKEDYYDSEKWIEYTTCGYYLGQTKRAMNFVLSKRVSLNSDGTTLVDSFMQIPKKAILKIKKF